MKIRVVMRPIGLDLQASWTERDRKGLKQYQLKKQQLYFNFRFSYIRIKTQTQNSIESPTLRESSMD